MDFDIVRQSARVVPLRTVNKQLTSDEPFMAKSEHSRIVCISFSHSVGQPAFLRKSIAHSSVRIVVGTPASKCTQGRSR